MKKVLCGLFAIIICLSITGCGDKSNDEKKLDKKDVTNSSVKKQSSKDEKNVENYVIEEEDGKVIIPLTGNTTQVYYHDGKNVTDFEVYIDWGSNKEAKSMYNSLKDMMTDEALGEIDSIDVKGQYVVYNYNKEGYGIETYDELIEFAKVYNIILDANSKYKAEDEISWVSTDYPRPDDCTLVSAKDDINGIKVFVKWDSIEAAKEYKSVIKNLGDFGTVEETDDYFAFQGTKVRISYSNTDEKENYILFISE